MKIFSSKFKQILLLLALISCWGCSEDYLEKTEIKITPLPDVMIKILNDGGLAKHIEKHGDFQLV